MLAINNTRPEFCAVLPVQGEVLRWLLFPAITPPVEDGMGDRAAFDRMLWDTTAATS